MKVYIVSQYDPYDSVCCHVESVWAEEARARAEVDRLMLKETDYESFDYEEWEVRQ